MKKTQFATAIITLAFAGSVSAAMPVTTATTATMTTKAITAAPAPSRAELIKSVKMQQGSVTRAQVIAEMKRARAAGEIPITEFDFRQFPEVVSTLTRKEVMTEYKRAKANGEIAVTQAEYGRIPLTTSTLTREEVRAEYKRAKANGEIAVTQADYNVINTKSYHKGYSAH
jgi:hypothetical protein